MQERGQPDTHCTNRIKQALLHQRVPQTSLITLPSSPITPAHRRPRPVDPGATTAKQQVVVQPVFFARRSPAAPYRRRGPLDGEYDGRIIGRRKDVATNPICVGFPTKRIALHPPTRAPI